MTQDEDTFIVSEEERSFTPNSSLARGMLLLHTPWMLDKKFDRVGIANQVLPEGPDQRDHLLQCTLWNSTDKKAKALVPDLDESFVAWVEASRTSGVPGLDLGVMDDRWSHRHNLSHSHDADDIDGSEDDHVGDHSQVPGFPGAKRQASTNSHKHLVELLSEEGPLVIKPPMDEFEVPLPEPTQEPPHVEVNAYYVFEDMAAHWTQPNPLKTAIPAGTIVFHTKWVNYSSWDLVSTEGMPDPNTPIDPNVLIEDQKPDRLPHWDKTLFKIVSCIPENRIKGFETHFHGGLQHSHQLGQIGEARGEVDIDNDLSDDGHSKRYAVPKHSHSSGHVSMSAAKTGDASNYPLHMPFLVYVSKGGSRWDRGMMVPFVTEKNGVKMKIPKGWELVPYPSGWKGPRDGRTDHSHVFLSSWNDGIGALAGSHYHTHDYDHQHSVRLERSTQTGSVDPEHQVHVSRDHGHRGKSSSPFSTQPKPLDDWDRTGMRYFQVGLIRYVGS